MPLSQWLQLQWIILPALVIPLAVLLGLRRGNGAILVTGAGAILTMLFSYLRAIGSSLAYAATGPDSPVTLISGAGWYLLVACWTLTLVHTAQERRWRWFVAILVAGYLSFTSEIFYEFYPNSCAYSLPDVAAQPFCQLPSAAFLLALTLGKAFGPALAIFYVLRATARRQRQWPEGVGVSSLRDGPAVDEGASTAD
jgi:hypothetical protein